MMISYCRVCLPDKVVIAYGPRRVDVDIPHDIHPQPSPRDGLFFIPDKATTTAGRGVLPEKAWTSIFVEGDDTQTKANIVAQYGDEFVE